MHSLVERRAYSKVFLMHGINGARVRPKREKTLQVRSAKLAQFGLWIWTRSLFVDSSELIIMPSGRIFFIADQKVKY
jgi:hypothetical protein